MSLVVLFYQLPDHRVNFIHVEVEDSSVRVAAAAAADKRDRGEIVPLLQLLLPVG